MATIEFLTKRIEGKQAEITKLEKKLDRINKAKASNWENNPYYYGDNDLRWTMKDLEAARTALKGYQDQLAAEQEKANSRNIPAIVEFLKLWKARVFHYYHEGLVEYFDLRKQCNVAYKKYNNAPYGTPEQADAKAEYEKISTLYHGKINGYYRDEPYTDRYGKPRTKHVKYQDGELEYLDRYMGYSTIEEAEAKLNSDLNRDAAAKYDDIVNRACCVVGTITDAKGLSVGAKGELNGIVIGTKARARIETIGAGGYNIQCFHFRTLIHELK